MKINSSEMNMTSASSYLLSEKEDVRITNADGGCYPAKAPIAGKEKESGAQARFVTNGGDTVEIGKEGQQAVDLTGQTEQGMGLEMQRYTASVFEWAADAIDQVIANFKVKMMEKHAFHATGAETVDLNELALEAGKDSFGLQVSIYQESANQFRALARQMRPDETIRRTETRIMENTSVQAGGMVRTADGREISFNLDVAMSRSVQSSSEQIQTLRMVDPLVIDLTGNGTELSNDKMDFDLDGDGVQEQVARTASGSAFLTLDLNGDGKVNSGKELFGPTSGDGFAELSFYDSDGNRWIDENDDIYDKLKVWIQDGSEEGALKSLSEAGIGAIHLGNIVSEFQVQGERGETLGQVRSTGVALTETGEARAVQQIDLTV